MRITETQRQHIDALFCERLSSNIDDRSLKLLNKLMTYLDDISVQSELAEEELVTYYRDNLFFKEAVDMATAKPIYDLTCKFMYQETSNLQSEKDYFFNHYNVDYDEA